MLIIAAYATKKNGRVINPAIFHIEIPSIYCSITTWKTPLQDSLEILSKYIPLAKLFTLINWAISPLCAMERLL